MRLTSNSFHNNEFIPEKYTCDGLNINPQLEISEIPENSKSLVLIVDDPDASVGTWVHWTIWNINPESREIHENHTPENTTEGVTDFGRPGYGGPCPHEGTHRYFFKVYALDTKLNLDPNNAKPEIEKAMQGHILDETVLIGLYKRN